MTAGVTTAVYESKNAVMKVHTRKKGDIGCMRLDACIPVGMQFS
jgi:hypothetical protein